jgi:Mg2+/Co2+ transporter CorB
MMHKQFIDSKHSLEDINIMDILTEPLFIPENVLIAKQLDIFRSGHSHIACVVDEYGSLKGIITLEDILEEVFGQIYDEYDPTVSSMIVAHGPNEFTIDASMPVRDLNRELDWDLPEEFATTVAGFLIHQMRKIPEQDEVFTFKDIQFIITRKTTNRIKTVKVILLQTNDNNK